MEKNRKLVQDEFQKLLAELDIKADLQIEEQEEGFKVLIETPDNALLIGKHGNTLSSIESIFNSIVAKKAGEFVRVTLEIGAYRQEREDYLKNLANKLKDEVMATGFEKTIRGLKPWERRAVHMYLQEDGDVTTESTGEGRDRVLIIKKK